MYSSRLGKRGAIGLNWGGQMFRSIRWAACAAFLFGVAPQASATIYQVDFAGSFVSGAYIGPNFTFVDLTGKSYSSEFIFNSELMTLGTDTDGRHKLTGGPPSATMTIETYGSFAVSGAPFFIFNDDFTSIVANVGETFNHILMSSDNISSGLPPV